jgi:hypothetical protein
LGLPLLLSQGLDQGKLVHEDGIEPPTNPV